MIAELLLAAMGMVTLHRADGGEVAVAAAHVTGLHSRPPPPGLKLAPSEAHCILWLADGRLLSVLEPCAVVRRLLEEATR
jgi:hypothetical protein